MEILQLFFFNYQVIVHPDYYQYSGETVIGQTDVALIKTASDLFGLNEDGTGTNDPKVEPICLPPKTGFMLDKNSTGVNEPFEDLDCKLIHGKSLIILVLVLINNSTFPK